jgi:chromosome segregation ATPase
MATIESTIDKSIAKMDAQLSLWNARLGELIAKGKVAGQEAKQDARERLDDLKAKIDAAQAKLEEAKKLRNQHWEEFRATIEGAWKQAEAAFKKLVE